MASPTNTGGLRIAGYIQGFIIGRITKNDKSDRENNSRGKQPFLATPVA